MGHPRRSRLRHGPHPGLSRRTPAKVCAKPILILYYNKSLARLLAEVTASGRVWPRDATGTVVSVYQGGAAYALELLDAAGDAHVITVEQAVLGRVAGV